MNIQPISNTIYNNSYPIKFGKTDRQWFNFITKSKPTTDTFTSTITPQDKLKVDESIFDSKTMKLLYSPEFYTPQKLNEDGYWETTIIDKKTKKPVKAYVKKTDSSQKNHEYWGIYVRSKEKRPNSSTKSGYVYFLVGERQFDLDKKHNKIMPGYMESRNKRYAGIGLRCHQISIERMMQEGCKTVEIDSITPAFKFHYKSGFRAIPNDQAWITDENYNKYRVILKDKGFKERDIDKFLSPKLKFNNYLIDNKSNEIMLKYMYANEMPVGIDDIIPMSLQGEHLEAWKQRAKSQPIIL